MQGILDMIDLRLSRLFIYDKPLLLIYGLPLLLRPVFRQALGQSALLAQILTHFSLFCIFLGFGDAQAIFLCSVSTRRTLTFTS